MVNIAGIRTGDPKNWDYNTQMYQLNGTNSGGKTLKFLSLSIGGNNAGFGNIVTSCIYHPPVDGVSYLPLYDNDSGRSSLCAKAIDGATNYIGDQTDRSGTLYGD